MSRIYYLDAQEELAAAIALSPGEDDAAGAPEAQARCAGPGDPEGRSTPEAEPEAELHAAEAQPVEAGGGGDERVPRSGLRSIQGEGGTPNNSTHYDRTA